MSVCLGECVRGVYEKEWVKESECESMRECVCECTQSLCACEYLM